MKAFLKRFVLEQYCIPWKLRLLARKWVPWTLRRRLFHAGRANLNTAKGMDDCYAALDDEFQSMENLYAHLLELLPERGRLLDAGCGIAVLLRQARRRYPDLELHGTDFSHIAVERAREYGFPAEPATLPDVPYPDEHFDCVVSTEVLEHLDDPVEAVRSFRRVLRPGGSLIVSVPLDLGPDCCDMHVQDFTDESIQECLREGGFRVESIERIVREPERCDGASLLVRSVKPGAPA